MEARATSAMHVIKKEDKQSVVRNFIAQELDAHGASDACAESASQVFLIARSPDSPVARAVVELADQIAARGLTVHAVFANANGPLTQTSGVQTGREGDQTRILRDARLLDAHEVLVIGAGASWVGDCMRRDPGQCDAYERFSTNCPVSVLSARSAFEKLWAGAQTTQSAWLGAQLAPAPENQTDDELIASSALTSRESDGLVTSATRH